MDTFYNYNVAGKITGATSVLSKAGCLELQVYGN